MEFTLTSTATEVLDKAAALAAAGLGLEGEALGAWGTEEKATAIRRWAKKLLEMEKAAAPVAPEVAGSVPRAEEIGSEVNHVGDVKRDGGDPSIPPAVQDSAVN
ncbi:uncharacterized protein LOC123412672 [Hordeum vulgare subsp. vulgare]|uniref:Uncharacterized protein n=1 Tax=Hordeum vulgare subsp. vulgare TaxID=112509 RepID=A0A8I6YIN5_HORVV|nr:uncharacterized protein LOC123412672 [Hordeum vulgare subsp. vulgare]